MFLLAWWMKHWRPESSQAQAVRMETDDGASAEVERLRTELQVEMPLHQKAREDLFKAQQVTERLDRSAQSSMQSQGTMDIAGELVSLHQLVEGIARGNMADAMESTIDLHQETALVPVASTKSTPPTAHAVSFKFARLGGARGTETRKGPR